MPVAPCCCMFASVVAIFDRHKLKIVKILHDIEGTYTKVQYFFATPGLPEKLGKSSQIY